MTEYESIIEYLLSFADFERSGRFQDRPDVAPMLALMQELGDPHLGRPTVHVAGSKGKGSVCAMTESILRAAGIRTGLYTSPHLHDYTERIRIDGEPVSRERFAELAAAVRPAVERASDRIGERSFVTFDLLTAMGFLAFRESRVEIQVIEVGLGGRVDSTNVFHGKRVAVIAPISLEHTAILGATIEEIAREKAGIITPGCTVVLARQDHRQAGEVIAGVAEAAGARVVEVDAESVLRRFADRIRVGLPGEHQLDNACTAITAVDALGLDIPDRAYEDGLAAVRWPGRCEVLREGPLVIADGAHNQDSARALRDTLTGFFGANQATFIIGSSADKNVESLAEELAPIAARVIATKTKHPRAMEPGRVRQAFERLGIPAEDVDSVGTAIERAMADTERGGVICLTGSLFVAAEGREWFGLR